MPDPTDHDLLREFARTGAEPAFAALVARHINLVYSAARRFTSDDTLAADITQAVFILLARKAPSLSPRIVLTGWLYQTARLTAANALKEKIRRQKREQEACMQSHLTSTETDNTWKQLAPALDHAMGDLRETDRNAVLLRYFENKPLAEVGAALGVSEDAARVRINRAVDKLRALLMKQGVTLGAAALAMAVGTNSVHAAPAGLALKTSVLATKGAAASTSTLTLVKGALKLMAWSKIQTTAVAAAVVLGMLGAGAGVYEYHSTHAGAPAELNRALHVPKPPEGQWQYPTEAVMDSLFKFGSNRAAAFPILEQAVQGPDREASKQAMAAMGFVGMPARPQYRLYGEPSPKVTPFLLTILNGSDSDLSYFALTSLRAIGFQPQDLPHLADLLAQSHGQSTLPPALDQARDLKTVRALMANANGQSSGQSLMQRYLPEAIAETIAKNPDTVAPYLPPVVDLLDDPDPDVRFGAACALAKYRGVGDVRISTALTAGLAGRHDTSRAYPDTEGVKQLMAIETLQRIGPDAKPMIPALLEFARSKTITDHLLHELAFRAAGHIDNSLRNTIPEVDQALKNDPSQ